MGRIVKLTESQLKQVIEKVIEEQSVNDAINSTIKTLKSVTKKLTNALTLPLHVRAFMNFTSLRKLPFTINDLTQIEKNALKKMLVFAEQKGLLKKNGSSVSFYNLSNLLNKGAETINFSDKKSFGLSQGNLKSDFTRIAMTLGNAYVKKSGEKYVINDRYDFNNYINNPSKYTLEKVPQTVVDSLVKIGTGNYVQGVEQLASYYQKLGYPGYPVQIEV